MARLSQDCFAHDGALLSLDAARRLVAEQVAPVAAIERVPIAEADNRTLAEDVAAPFSLPRFDNAAVDGYAVASASLDPHGPTTLPVAARIAAGAAALPDIPAAAIRIFTGAPMPPGYDAVVMQEDVQAGPGAQVTLPPGLRPGANRRLAGEDFAQGAPALSAGRRLSPRDLALLGAFGQAEVAVRARLRVALFSTGDEVAEDGRALGPGQIHDANRPMLAAMLARAGCLVSDLGALPDRPDAIAAALQAAAASHDALVTSGGVSTGEEDHVGRVVARDGTLGFWRVAIRPGRPMAAGTLSGAAFLGLPGNPVAAFVTFVLLARPILARLGGEDYRTPLAIPVPAGFAYAKRAGRREFLRVRLVPDADGRLVAAKSARDGSSLLGPLVGTDGLVDLPDDLQTVAPGDPVGFLPYGSLV